MMNFALKMMKCALRMMDFVLRNYVAFGLAIDAVPGHLAVPVARIATMIGHFSIENHHFSGDIFRCLCTFNIKFH